MKCLYCDQEIDQNVTVCPHCGGNVENKVEEVKTPEVVDSPNAPVTPSAPVEPSKPTNTNESKNAKKIIIIVAAIVIAIAIIGFIISKITNTVYNVVLESYDYESVPYYIVDEPNVIDNTNAPTESVTTTTQAITTIKPTIVTSRPTTITTYSQTLPQTTITKTTLTTKRTTFATTLPTTTTTTTTTTTMPVVTPPVVVTEPIYNEEEPTTTTSTTTTTTTTTSTTTTAETTTTKPANTQTGPVSRTILIYMVGSDLESQSGFGSSDIFEMASSYIDDYTNVYVYTGGSLGWHIDIISPYDNMLFKINSNYMERVNTFGNKNMGDAATLAEAINYVDSISKTDKFDLILWDHGGGPVVGYGSDEKTKDMLFMPEIYAALANTNFSEKRKMEFIGFDACLMGTYEIADILSPFANYLIASEESESGIGWNYIAFDNASKLSTLDFMKRIVDTMAAANIELAQYYPNNTYTLSIIDLSKIDNVVAAVDSSFKNLSKKLDSDFIDISRNRNNTLTFSSAAESVDIIHMTETYDKYNFAELKQATKDAIVYSSSNIKNANGLALYYPYAYQNRDNYFYYYSQQYGYDGHINYMNAFLKKLTASGKETASTLSNKQIDVSKKTISVDLTKNQVKNYRDMFYLIFRLEDDGTYTPVYRGDDFYQQGTTYVANYSGELFEVSDSLSDDVGNVLMIKEKVTNKGTLYKALVVLQSWDEDDFLGSMRMENGYAKFFIKDKDVTFQKIELLPDVQNVNKTELEIATKEESVLEDWNSVQFPAFRYKITDDKGHYTRDWESQPTKYLYEVTPKKAKPEFRIGKLDPKFEYYGVITYVDLEGNYSTSDLIKVN